MKKTVLAFMLLSSVLAMPAWAQSNENKHALGDMYTKALNSLESADMLDLLAPTKQVVIKDIFMNHGQVIIMVIDNNENITVIYDPIANVIVRPSP